MATELEQFVEANKQRLGEVNASNPQLYSAISMALDYLNKQYFGGTTELKVDIPQPTPVTPVETTQTDSVERLFTDEELKKHIMDNVWTFLDFKEIKIELTNDVQQQNFLNFIKLLLDRDTYVTRGNIGNYFYTDEDLVVGNSDDEGSFRQSPYQLLYYNQIFADLLKTQQTATKLPSVWDSAYSSKYYATPIDYNFLQKAIYSNRRSKDMKLEIARAFGEIKSIYKALDKNWSDVERDYGQSSSEFIYKYVLNDEVFEIIGNFGYDFNNIIQYTDLEIKDWIADLIFPDFEYPLKDDRVKEKLLEWYRNQVNNPTTQPNIPTTQANEFKPIWRVKTEQEFIDEFGEEWYNEVGWSVVGGMNYLFGKSVTNPTFNGENFTPTSFNTARELGIDSGNDNTWYLRQQMFKKIEAEDEESKATPQDANLQNAKFKVGDRVKIIAQGAIYTTYTKMFKKMGFANQIKNDEGKDGDIGTIFAVEYNNEDKRILYGVLVELGATRKYQTLISERGLELFQPTPLSASKFEVGDWVRLVDNDRLVGIDIGAIGLVTKFDSDNDPKIEWQEYKLVSENGTYVANRFELALKKPKPIFKIGDLVRWKEDVYNYNVKQGAIAEVVGFGVFDGNILANVEWVDTKDNMLKVSSQSDGGYNEDFFELALSNEKAKKIAENVAIRMGNINNQPEETTITTTSEDKDEEDFEDLADELENLDF